MHIERLTPNSARAVRTYALGPRELLAAARQAVGRLPRWRLEEVDGTALRAVRTTRFFRFEDDVAVRVTAHEHGARAEFSSASRVGTSDLGQNPRNLRELFRALERGNPADARPAGNA